RRVHAVAQAGGLGAVVEDVAQVRVALGAQHFVAGHTDAAVGLVLHVLLGDRLPEAGPAGAGVELGRRAEQRVLAADAAEDPLGVQVPVLAGEGALGAGEAGHVKLLGGELGAPFGVGLDDFGHALGADLLAGVGELHDLDVGRGGGAGFGRIQQAHNRYS